MPTIPAESSEEQQASHEVILSQARYILYTSIGSSIKREISKERFSVGNVLQLWTAIRSCFFLRDEGTIQQIRDDIMNWDLEKAGGWNLFVEGLERFYSRLDICAAARSYMPSDKLFKLRNVLSKLNGEKERSIYHQVELLVDTVSGDDTAVYQACFKFADKRMKLIDHPIAAKQAAFSAVSSAPPRQTAFPRQTPIARTCPYCNDGGHLFRDCPRKRSDIQKGTVKACTTWNARTRLCAWGAKTGKRCSYKHSTESASNVMARSCVDVFSR